MQVCTLGNGKTVVMASGKPFSPSTTAIRMSSTLRLRNFHEKAVKLFLNSFHTFLGAVDRASIRTRYLGPCFDPLFAAKGWNVAISSRSLMLSFRFVSQSFRIVRPQLGVKSSRTPAAASGAGFGGAQAPADWFDHRGEGFIRFTGFPSVRSNTASFRATATTARFLALAVPSWARRSPCSRSALSVPKGPRIYCAAFTSRHRRYWSPHLEMRNSLSVSPLWSRLGHKPRLRCRAFAGSDRESPL